MRDENMVHTLEHGAVWITYNPTKVAAGDLDILKGLVQGVDYMVMSPYPTLDQPISLQAWGHQLKVTSASDPRVKQFITALLRNPYNYPEVGATCEQPTFPTTDIPQSLQFDPSPRDSSAVPLDGGTIAPATTEMNGAAPPPRLVGTRHRRPGSSATGSAPATGIASPPPRSSAPATSSRPEFLTPEATAMAQPHPAHRRRRPRSPSGGSSGATPPTRGRCERRWATCRRSDRRLGRRAARRWSCWPPSARSCCW